MRLKEFNFSRLYTNNSQFYQKKPLYEKLHCNSNKNEFLYRYLLRILAIYLRTPIFQNTSHWLLWRTHATVITINSFTSSFDVVCLSLRLFFSEFWQYWKNFLKIFFLWLLLHPINLSFLITEMEVIIKVKFPICQKFHLQ